MARRRPPRARPRRLGAHRPRRRPRLVQRLRRARTPPGRPRARTRRGRVHGRRRVGRGALVGPAAEPHVAVLHTTTWNDDGGAPVVCVHGVTGHGGRFRRLAERLRRQARRRRRPPRARDAPPWEAPWTAETHLADLLETADAHGIGAATWIGHSFGGRLVAELASTTPRPRRARRPPRSRRCTSSPPVATERAEGLRGDLSFGSPDEAIDARLGDGSLVSTPRATLEEEAAVFLDQGEDGRWRWRFSPAAVIAAWSEMASPRAALARLPDARRDRREVLDPEPGASTSAPPEHARAGRAQRPLGRPGRDRRRGRRVPRLDAQLSAATSRSYAGSVRNSTKSGSVAIRSKMARASA